MARILIIAGDGCSHVDYPYWRMLEEGFDVTIAAPRKKRLHVILEQQEEGWDTYIERPSYAIDADASLDDIDPSTFDALILPGGRAPEYLRTRERCIKIVRHFLESNKPIAAICRGPLILVEALAAAGMKGRRMTGRSQIKPRVTMGGCTYVEARHEAVVDGNIVTVTGRPCYHLWIRTFLRMLKERGIYSPKGG